jgi:hypothetical protein
MANAAELPTSTSDVDIRIVFKLPAFARVQVGPLM